MKQRVISATVALALFVPILLYGGWVFEIAVLLLAIQGLREFIHIKETRKKMPDFVKVMSFLLLTIMVLSKSGMEEFNFLVDFRLISALFLAYLIPVVMYHKREVYSVNDAFYLISGLFFIGTAFNLLILIRNTSLLYIVYLFIITIMTDTYAYFIGSLIGRHKLLEVISPKKTWEGSIGGTLFGVLIGATFFHVVVNPTIPIYFVTLMTLFLSIIAQFGDLVFSSIKRYYGKKDFSNIMPGHGGILDRLDSIIFVMLGFMFFITII